MKKQSKNFLDNVYSRNPKYEWEESDDGQIIILVENTGIFNLIAQKLFKKPRVSKIHMEEMGSYIWKSLDDEKSVYEVGELVKVQFGEKAEPLYERLSVYMKQLADYGFIVEIQDKA